MRRLQSKAIRRAPTKEKPSSQSWKALRQRPTPEQLTLLEMIPGVRIFEDPEGRLYRCEIGSDGCERWFVKSVGEKSEWLSQSEAARLLGVSRQAIGNAIGVSLMADCNRRPKVCRTDVLSLKSGMK